MTDGPKSATIESWYLFRLEIKTLSCLPKSMAHHIILSAFGTTTQSKLTYNRLHKSIAPEFPGSTIVWSYSSPTVRHSLPDDREDERCSLTELLLKLGTHQDDSIVVQSLHVMPGHEFHRVVRETRQSSIPATIGMPLLTSPEDYLRVADCLKPLIDAHRDAAVLLLGHGTTHPSWTAYPTLEQVLRSREGSRVFVAGLENFPGSESVLDQIAISGFTEVMVIPFLMVAGMHFNRDIVGDTPLSWKSRLAERGITLIMHDKGLGELPGISDIFCDHIHNALKVPQT